VLSSSSVSRHKAALYRPKRCLSCGPSPERDSLPECMTEGLRVASLALNVTRQLPVPDRNSAHPLNQAAITLSDTTPLDAGVH
jgi:hypothetical protein